MNLDNIPLKLIFDFPTQQWVLSIVVGINYAKILSSISFHLDNHNRTKFYLPYVLVFIEIFLLNFTCWHSASSLYEALEDKKLLFFIRATGDFLPTIYILHFLPKDGENVDSYLDLKALYYRSKRFRPFIYLIYVCTMIITQILSLESNTEIYRFHATTFIVQFIIFIAVLTSDNFIVLVIAHTMAVMNLIIFLIYF